MFGFLSGKEKITDAIANDRMATFLRLVFQSKKEVFLLATKIEDDAKDDKELNGKWLHINGHIHSVLFQSVEENKFSQLVFIEHDGKEIKVDVSNIEAASLVPFSSDDWTRQVFSSTTPPSFDKFPVLIKKLDCVPYDSRDIQYLNTKKANTRFYRALFTLS